ncbi:hypothetical protein [Jiangella endophytica]|uniref:hypothetical protein n=1 Tax=Jiangella endophytica TaxID=1623398 RepID=UPI00130065E3|nr:hypothetical protein [Jiangella endophytica]
MAERLLIMIGRRRSIAVSVAALLVPTLSWAPAEAAPEPDTVRGALAPGDVLFADDFEDGTADGWATRGGTWAVVDGATSKEYLATHNDGGSTTLTGWAGSTTWSDYSVEAVVTTGHADNATSLRGRYTDADNAYLLQLSTKNDTVSLIALVGGVATTLQTASVPLDVGVPYHLELEMVGGAIAGRIDGQQLVSATDASLAAGMIAAGGYTRGTFGIDDVVVTDLRPVPEGDRYVTPLGAGAQDGSSWANAFPGDQAGGLQRAWDATGTTNTLFVGSGEYTTPQTFIMASGGESVASLKTVSGVDTGAGLPTFVGDFTLANQGSRAFIHVAEGVSHWRVSGLRVENYFYGIMTEGHHVGVRIDDFDVANTSDAIYLWGLPRDSTADPATASHDIIITGGDYLNYTKSAVRFRNGNYLASVIDTRADAGGAANWVAGNFPMGFRVGAGTSGQPGIVEHDIVFQDVVSRNSHHEAAGYWNGDGFAAERDSRDITYIRSRAFDSTDGGFDDKSNDPAYVDTIAFGNKRNYRIWSHEGAQYFNVVGGHSHRRGGSGNSLGLHVTGAGIADVYFSTFTENENQEIGLENADRVDLHDSIVAKTNGTELYSLGGGTVTPHRTEEFIAGVQGTDPQFVEGDDAAWEGGSDAFDSQVYGTTRGYHSGGDHDTPYTITTGAPSVAVEVQESVSVTVSVTDAANQPVTDPERIVWYSDAGDTARLLASRGATVDVEGLAAGTTEVVALYRGERLRIPVTVAD